MVIDYDDEDEMDEMDEGAEIDAEAEEEEMDQEPIGGPIEPMSSPLSMSIQRMKPGCSTKPSHPPEKTRSPCAAVSAT